LLSALPTICPVVVGAGGARGTSDISNFGLTTNGGDGGFSSFNGSTCEASGGKGGLHVQSNSFTVATQANGGDGGIGGRTAAGGGAKGGTAGIPTATGPGTAGVSGLDGIWDGKIGSGGGGGAGGVGKYGSGGLTCNAATSGGRGSYNPSDASVYGPGDVPDNDPNSGSPIIVPGGASGGKTAPLSGLPYLYGQSQGSYLAGSPGVVTIQFDTE
jgi:hypothetical protein